MKIKTFLNNLDIPTKHCIKYNCCYQSVSIQNIAKQQRKLHFLIISAGYFKVPKSNTTDTKIILC